MYTTSDMYNVTMQPYRTIHLKIEILNKSFYPIGEFTGVTTDCDISEDATSDIRRTCNITMVANSAEYDVMTGGKVWLDKYIRIYVGIENIRNSEIVWFNKGVFLINEPSYEYSPDTATLTFTGVDIMAKLTGARGGIISEADIKISQGESIKSVIPYIIKDIAKMSNVPVFCEVRDGEDEIPNDLEFEVGSSVYEMLDEIRKIYSNYQIYFDEDNIFHYEPISVDVNSTVSVDWNMFNKLYLSHNNSVSFEDVKNSIEVYGATHEPSYFASEVSIVDNTINLTFSDVTEYNDGLIFGFELTNAIALSNPYININSLGSYPTYLITGKGVNVPIGTNVYYCIYSVLQYRFVATAEGYVDIEEWGQSKFLLKFNEANGTSYSSVSEITSEEGTISIIDVKFRWLGHLQAYGKAEDTNEKSPFYITDIGSIPSVLSGGDYDSISSDDLAENTANYELYKATRLQNTISIECVPIYYIKPYELIEFKLPYESEAQKYLIQSINTTISESGTQQITAIKHYENIVVEE